MADRTPQRRERRPTLADVAAAAGVSVALVSIVMRDVPGASEATRRRVRQVAAELDYRPDQRARLLRQQRSRLLGVTFEVQQAFHGDLVEGIYAAAEPAGYDVMLSAVSPGRRESRAIEALLGDRCEAVLLLGPRSLARAIVQLADRLPVVVVARQVRSTAVDCVRVDDRAGMDSAVSHLVNLGHRRIVYLDGGRAPGAPERLRGLRAAAARSEIADDLRVLPGGPTEEEGAQAARLMLVQNPRATAVIAFNDRCATGVLDTLLRCGVRTPQDISVVGYDDSRLSRISYYNLTTVGQNPHLLGELAVQRVIARLDDPQARPNQDTVVEPQLMIRGTTGPPAAQ